MHELVKEPVGIGHVGVSFTCTRADENVHACDKTTQAYVCFNTFKKGCRGDDFNAFGSF
jgi:hypothetical protein